uniref:DP domain-containing protein n=1 Tax=Parastrongyloides trichosuri TaxID=131310 RepID=A0A0N4Z0J2_PARTI
MLDRGLVALDTAVHEQKLNFLRAQITILNNRIKDLLLSSEYGMPDNAVIGSGNVKIGYDKDNIPLVKIPKREVKLCDFKKDNGRFSVQLDNNEHLRIRHRVPSNDYFSSSSGTSTPSSFITRYTNQIPDTLC